MQAKVQLYAGPNGYTPEYLKRQLIIIATSFQLNKYKVHENV